jgi:hypothetical protein
MIDANAAGSGPRLDISVNGSSVAMCDDGDALTIRGPTIGNAALLRHAARPRGRSVEFWAGSPRSALLRSRS